MFFELQKKKKKKKEKHQLKLTQKKRINEQTKDRQCEVTFLDSTSQANQSQKASFLLPDKGGGRSTFEVKLNANV